MFVVSSMGICLSAQIKAESPYNTGITQFSSFWLPPFYVEYALQLSLDPCALFSLFLLVIAFA